RGFSKLPETCRTKTSLPSFFACVDASRGVSRKSMVVPCEPHVGWLAFSPADTGPATTAARHSPADHIHNRLMRNTSVRLGGRGGCLPIYCERRGRAVKGLVRAANRRLYYLPPYPRTRSAHGQGPSRHRRRRRGPRHLLPAVPPQGGGLRRPHRRPGQ